MSLTQHQFEEIDRLASDIASEIRTRLGRLAGSELGYGEVFVAISVASHNDVRFTVQEGATQTRSLSPRSKASGERTRKKRRQSILRRSPPQ